MSKTKKIISALIILILLLGVSVILFSPYGDHAGYNYKLVLNTMEINAPVDSVFAYLGNSANASHWSVFVDHITPINTGSVPDGHVGSIRRCFCNPDEKGKQWDELITEVIPGKKRQITIYAMKDFFMTADHLATEQIYESLGNNKTRLTFTLFFKDTPPTIWESLKTYIAAYWVKNIYERNMDNIKRIIETKH